MPTNSPSSRDRVAPAIVVGGAIVFAVLATLNAGGYRYGASDQAFYIPAIRHQLDPSLFPRDWAMLGAQGRFFFVDEIGAALVGLTGLGLPVWFAVAQVVTLGVLYAGALSLGSTLLGSPWAVAAWLAALTLRHRIAKTGVNTLESYFHPRMLVFGLGLASLALFLRGRPWWALALAAASGGLHPTTGALFVGVLVVAIVVGDPSARVPAAAAAGVGVLGIGVAIGAGLFDVQTMDPTWLALLATKDYVFPTQWSLETWLVNLAGPALLLGIGAMRHRRGLMGPRERGVAAGALALVAGFLLSLPFIAEGVALAIQLQTSRAFWPVEILATLLLVWAVTTGSEPRASNSGRARVVAVLLLAVSLARGVYVGGFESPERPLVSLTLPDTDWTRALAWVRDTTPTDAFLLADPGHAWQAEYGTAIRIGAERDVYLEETKDVAMALYSRDVARTVTARIATAALAATADGPALSALAAREGLTHFVTSREVDLPRLHTSGRIHVYAFRR